jgi:hypothetical protein
MRVRVDEPGATTVPPASISARPAGHRADLGDAAAGHGQIAASRRAGAIDDETTTDHQNVREMLLL